MTTAKTAPTGAVDLRDPETFERLIFLKQNAAWLLEQVGFHKGYVLGRAGISSKHTLALINRDSASATDIAALRDEIIVRVAEKFAIRLEQEPVWVG